MRYKQEIYKDKRAIIVIATICCMLWGMAYPAIKISYELFDIQANDIGGKLLFAGFRFTIAGILLFIYGICTRLISFKITTNEIKATAILGFMQTTLQYLFFYVGMSYVSGVRGSILNGTGAFFSIIFAHFIFKNDKLSIRKILGCMIGFLGIIIVNLRGGNLGGEAFSFRGDGFVIISAAIFSVSSIYCKKVTEKISPIKATSLSLFIGGIILLLAGVLFGGRLNTININSIIVMIILILISSIAFAFWNKLLSYNKVSTISIFNFLIPMFGCVFSAIFLGENIFDIKIIIALILVCIGIYLVNKNKNKHINN